VGEWLKPTDCKSVPPSEVRRFESFPVHQIFFLAAFGLEAFGLAEYEPLGDSADFVPDFGCAGVYDVERSADPGWNAADSWAVRF
jgi:hypothetical protein